MLINYFGTSLFWTSVVSIAFILSLATLLGRAVSSALPARFRSASRFYLAPVLGLAVLTILAEFIGRLLPLGNTVWVPLVTIALTLWSLMREPKITNALLHALVVSLFGIVCGVSLLASLYVYGGFNSHNDTFTYLAHSIWLQDHAFSELIASNAITPLNSQVYLYQKFGFRMGGSFLLGMMQRLLNARFPYAVYPAISMVAVATCCLAMGFPLAAQLRRIRRPIRLALLALPALSGGGLVFGASEGFLPQTLGLTFGGASLFLAGPLLRWAAGRDERVRELICASLPLALLLVATLFTYTEFSPFVVIVVGASAGYVAFRYRRWKGLAWFGGTCAITAAVALNTELLRAYAAIRLQSGVVVGNAVDWPLFGFFMHALGLYGGDSQGKFPLYSTISAMLPLYTLTALLGVVSVVAIAVCLRSVRDLIVGGIIMPAVLMLALLSSAFLYFRYGVASPFPSGTGQSWSQFKLAEWIHPFAMTVMLAALVRVLIRFPNYLEKVIVLIFLTGVAITSVASVERVAPIAEYYGGTHDLYSYYLGLRKTVAETCGDNSKVYLELDGGWQKFRQMAAVFLYDRLIISDWSDDPWVSHWLSAPKQAETVRQELCVISPRDDNIASVPGATIGPFQVSLGPPQGVVKIESEFGGYGRETDGAAWWHWVERAITFKLAPSFIPGDIRRTRVRFEYASTQEQAVTLRLSGANGRVVKLDLGRSHFPPKFFDQVIDFPPSELEELTVETSDPPSPLGATDPRLAAFIVRNVKLSAVPN